MLELDLHFTYKRSIFKPNIEIIEIASFSDEMFELIPIHVKMTRHFCQGALMEMALDHIDLAMQEGGEMLPMIQKKYKNMKVGLYFKFKQKSNQIELHYKLQFYNKKQRDAFTDWLAIL